MWIGNVFTKNAYFHQKSSVDPFGGKALKACFIKGTFRVLSSVVPSAIPSAQPRATAAGMYRMPVRSGAPIRMPMRPGVAGQPRMMVRAGTPMYPGVRAGAFNILVSALFQHLYP